MNIDVSELENREADLEKKYDTVKKETKDLEQKYQAITEYLGIDKNRENQEKEQQRKTDKSL